MAEHPNVGRTREYLDTFARGDFDGLRKFFADDVLWHVAGDHQLAGDYHGKDALVGYFEKAGKLTGGTLRLEPTSIMASDGHVGMFLRVKGQRNGLDLDIEMAEAFTVRPDGTWSEFWSMADDQDTLDRFWS
jgi:uncharacterized protein